MDFIHAGNIHESTKPDVRALHRGVIEFHDGSSVKARRIGKGMFSVAYLVQEGEPTVYVFTKDGTDYSKEMMASIQSDNPGTRHIPDIEEAGSTSNSGVVRMPHYKAPLKKANSAKGWAQYRVLKRCWDKAEERLNRKYGYSADAEMQKVHSGYVIMDEVLQCAREDKEMPASLIEALRLLGEYSRNYGSDYSFEFSPRNLATDKRGDLILLDVVFSREIVRKMRLAQMRKSRYG